MKGISRRGFLAVAGTTGALAATGCLGREAVDRATPTPEPTPKGQVDRIDAYPRVKVGTVSDLGTGDVMEFEYPLQGQNNFVTKIGTDAWGGVGPDGDIVAFNAACTHAGCSVVGALSPEESSAGPCPCHYTSFDLSKGGIVNFGQATTDLPQVSLEIEDGDIYATSVDDLVWGYHDNLSGGTPVSGGESA